MNRAGLILAGLVCGVVTFGGSALAASPAVAAESAPAIILPGFDQNNDDARVLHFGERNNLGQDNDILDVNLLNELLGRVLSN